MATVTLLTIAGGVALILFGVRFLRKGLDRLFGSSLRLWIQRLAGRRFRAFFSGIGIAVIAPSSTTLSVLAVQTIQAGHATSRQMLALMFGADIGMTVTVLLLALRFEQYAPILIFVGLPFYQFTKATRSRGMGQVIMALGFVFMGVMTIRQTVGHIEPDENLINLIEAAGAYPLVLTIIAAVIAVALQSSTATIAMIIGMAAGEKLDIPITLAMSVVVGANIGIGITTLLIGWSQIESRRLALGNLLAKMVAGFTALAAIHSIGAVMDQTPLTLPQQIAAFHLGLNVVMAMVAMPLVGQISWLTRHVVPQPSAVQSETFGPRYINYGPIDSVALALGQSMREILRVAEIVRSMLNELWQAMQTNDETLATEVSGRDDEVDLLDTQIKRFLARLSDQGLDSADASEQMRQLRYINELETIGDIIDNNLSELVCKKIHKGVDFSQDGEAELNTFYEKVTENMLIAETAFAARDEMLARKLLRHKERINGIERELRDRHFERLNAGLSEAHETSAIHLDVLTHLKRINSSVSHIAYALLQDTQGDLRK